MTVECTSLVWGCLRCICILILQFRGMGCPALRSSVLGPESLCSKIGDHVIKVRPVI